MAAGVCTIYRITNNVNGKIYVGQTWKTLSKRFRLHRNDAVSRIGHCTKLVRAILKYGIEAFSIEPLTTASTQEDADAFEVRFIVELDAIRRGYNLREGGAHGRLNEETRAKMSAAHKGKSISPETRAKIAAALTGRKLGAPSPETRARISAALTGVKRSDAQREVLSKSHQGKSLSVDHRARQTAGKRALWAAMSIEERLAKTAAFRSGRDAYWAAMTPEERREKTNHLRIGAERKRKEKEGLL